jgi:hypothetical protein
VSAQALIRQAQASGVALRLVDGKVKATGPREAIARLLAPLREHRAALADALQAKPMELLPSKPADAASEPADWHSLDAAYLAHHFNCPTCIAAGRGSRYGQRCSVGTALAGELTPKVWTDSDGNARPTQDEVAAQTSLPAGTVKTICARSGAFKDNPALRELFALPPVKHSDSKALTVPMLQPEATVTGDTEIDLVLGLREVIKTGQAELIKKAMQAATRIKTPLKELEERYSDYLVAKNPGKFMAAFDAFDFADLESLAQGSSRKLTRKNEAMARFGSIDNLYGDTPAEQFCVETLAGLKRPKEFGNLNEKQVDARFMASPDLLPRTLSDCLLELAYWHDLYTLREAVGSYPSDPGPQAYARECFIYRRLAHIHPQNRDEAVAVFLYVKKLERMEETETHDILLNLIGHCTSDKTSVNKE